ncbi:hypothetical protein [uncultured Roseobacter sp.]|uniref:hypothetical protein n=1 Tax=uncultured Roseobacter sp. TaxID=114847 RepID=UPI0026333548|nr:hypothetical protein [uncultured Roseobacter sp.]
MLGNLSYRPSSEVLRVSVSKNVLYAGICQNAGAIGIEQDGRLVQRIEGCAQWFGFDAIDLF